MTEVSNKQTSAEDRTEVPKPEHPDGEHRPGKSGDDARQKRRRRWWIAAGVVVAVAIATWGLYYWISSWGYESTDDAFIDGQIVQVSPRVSGHVLRVYIDDNQEVEAGDLLFELDPRDFAASLNQARGALNAAVAAQAAAQISVELTEKTAAGNYQAAVAAVSAAQAQVASASAQVAVAQSQVEEAKSRLASARADAEKSRASVESARAQAELDAKSLQRSTTLFKQGYTPAEDHDIAVAAAKSSGAKLQESIKAELAAEAAIAEAEAGVQVAEQAAAQRKSGLAAARAALGEAQARQAEADVVRQRVDQSKADAQQAAAEIERLRAAADLAELQLSYTKVYASLKGHVTRKSIQPGDFVQAGQPVTALVTPDVWVTANFKETQLTYMRANQPVTVHVDAYPGRALQAHVDSIQRGTGARFSLLPPENATGNYVKVVQRVPVKIVFDEPLETLSRLSPGMSVEPRVKVR